jgi:hypothetical protein
MLGKVIVEGLRLIDVDLELCMYQILMLMGGSKKAQGITKHEVIIQVNPIRHVDYTTFHAKTMVMQAIPYDVLVGGQFCTPWESPYIFGRRLLIVN